MTFDQCFDPSKLKILSVLQIATVFTLTVLHYRMYWQCSSDSSGVAFVQK